MDSRDGRMVLYRGSLKSCNYRCSYCPFSKHPRSERELLKDKKQWFQFCESLAVRAEQFDIRAVMVVPYGEALIHPWYWEGLGRLGAMDIMDGVGAQTNLSFSIEESLEVYERAGGKAEKLRMWATFHPEMAAAEEFAEKCTRLCRAGITVSAGAVGAVENLVKKYAKQVTPLKKITPHKLRSTYGTTLYQETGDIYLVADVLGHKDVNTTRKHYAAQDENRRRMAAKAVKLRED